MKIQQDTVRRPSPRQFDSFRRGTGFSEIELNRRRVLETPFVDFAVDTLVIDNRYFPHPAVAPFIEEVKATLRPFLRSACFRCNGSDIWIKTHVGHLMAKLGLRDRIQVVVYAYETGLIAPQGRR